MPPSKSNSNEYSARSIPEKREIEKFKDAILDSMTSQVVVLDHNGDIVAVNDAWRRFAAENAAQPGRVPDHTDVGTNYLTICAASTGDSCEGSEEAHAGILAVVKGRLPNFSFEYPCHSAYKQRWFTMSVTPLGGKDQGVVIAHTDITTRKQFENKLTQSESTLRSLIDALPDLIWLKDSQGIYLSCNARFEQFFGANEAQIVGKTDYDFVAADVADAFRANDRAAMETGKPGTNLEWISFANDGHAELLQTLKTPIYNADHSLKGILGIGHDVTEVTSGQDELRANALFLNTLLEALPVAVFYKGVDGRYSGLNSAFERLTSYTRNELLGKTVFDITSSELAEIYHAKDMELMQNPGVQEYEAKMRSAQGRVHDVVYHKATFVNSSGQVAGLIGVVLDVTERKRFDRVLQQKNEELENAKFARPRACS